VILSLAELLDSNTSPPPALVEPGLLPASGILFLGGEPKVGKSILVANLALALAAGVSRAGFQIPQSRRVLLCQFELPTASFAARLAQMRAPLGSAADQRLFIDTGAGGHLLSSSQGLAHFQTAAASVAAEVLILDPLYSAHDQDENDTRAMAALCQSLLRLREQTGAALIVIHHIRKSVARHEVGTAFRGSSALHAVGDSYLLLTRPSSQLDALELRFQLRYASALPARLLSLDPETLWFAASQEALDPPPSRRKVSPTDVQQALHQLGASASYSALRHQIMTQAGCCKRTAQLAIAEACRTGALVRKNGSYQLPDFAGGSRRQQTLPAGSGRPEGRRDGS
jgi:hypothetical protein